MTEAEKDVLRESLHFVKEEKQRRAQVQQEREEGAEKKRVLREEKNRVKEETAEKARLEEELRMAESEAAPAAT